MPFTASFSAFGPAGGHDGEEHGVKANTRLEGNLREAASHGFVCFGIVLRKDKVEIGNSEYVQFISKKGVLKL